MLQDLIETTVNQFMIAHELDRLEHGELISRTYLMRKYKLSHQSAIETYEELKREASEKSKGSGPVM